MGGIGVDVRPSKALFISSIKSVKHVSFVIGMLARQNHHCSPQDFESWELRVLPRTRFAIVLHTSVKEEIDAETAAAPACLPARTRQNIG